MVDTSGAQAHDAEPVAVPARGDRRQLLRSDCASCFGLCCVALSFSRSSDFAIDKDAGEPCVNLQEDFGCGIHARLRSSGFRGCTVFECFGAGQKVAQGTFDGVSWRDDPATRASMFAVFPVMREVHELLWYLNEAVALSTGPAHAALGVEVLDVLERTERIADGAPEEILAADVHSHRDAVVELLGRVSAAVRASSPSGKRIKRVGPRADLMGARLAGTDLRGVNLRGSYLIAADLHGADLRSADLIGADLRDTDVRGADLSTALFVTQPQLTAAMGDAATLIPPILERPAHWAA
ncbi:pentapeptide repeat-containing protein [Labedella endophytica]|uniref:Pentapeptide repeat-containing protein n=1 Tax=Labedella endophytica TaxID=1523160 RepID=A0A433JNU1_9MICO|nr:pentapeptide repeat-containing protein [Labedella endophytica]RUQ98130.1 pentapeptide repeat-containing protein [Labedella endophytica]